MENNVYVILIEYEIRNNNAVSASDTISINEFGGLFYDYEYIDSSLHYLYVTAQNVMKSGLAMSATIKVISYSPNKELVVLKEIHV